MSNKAEKSYKNGRQFEGWYKSAEALGTTIIALGIVAAVMHGSEILELANTTLQFFVNNMHDLGVGLEHLSHAYDHAPSYDLFTNLVNGTFDTTTAPRMLNKTNPDVIKQIQQLLPTESISPLLDLGN